MMNSSVVVFIKNQDCVSEYARIYLQESDGVYDGTKPYLAQIVNFFRMKKEYSISILGLGAATKYLKPQRNIELRVVNNQCFSRNLKWLRFAQNSFIILIYLFAKKPSVVIHMGDLYYLPALMIYGLLSRASIKLFLTVGINRYHLLNRLIKATGEKYGGVFSRNKSNIDILNNLGYSGQWDLFKPKYQEIPEPRIKPTKLREDKLFKVLFIGRLAYVKGIDILQQVALKSRDKGISLYVIGDGTYYESLRSFVCENKLDNLHLLGFIPNSEIYSFIRDSDVGFIPSKSEGVCKTALEFMIMEKPVVASNVGGIPEIIVNGKQGFLLDPDDADGFLFRIEQLKNDRELLADLSKGTLVAKEQILNYNKDFTYHLERIFR